ncbi:hypothetical protein GQR58_008869 [Nymphon striatum]|nr:hypothetical protein GQR58_008869 [Nymphon striatum]
MRRKTEIEEVEEETRKSKLLRSSIVPVNWKFQCFLCGNEATLDTKNPKRRPCHKVTFVEFHKTVLEQCRRRNDTWGNEVYTRLNCSNDLVADEGRYHRMCLQRFMINKRSPDAEVGEKGRPVDEAVNGRSNVLCFKDMISYFLHDLWDKERTRDEDKEAEIVVLTAAKLIMSEIREKEYDPSVYPKSDDITAPTDRWVPNLLKRFLQVLIKYDLKLQSFGQSIVQIAKPRSSVLPISFGLAVELDHVFGSKWLIDELSHLGFCSSYREVSRFKQSSMATEDASEVAVTLPPGSFAQYVADNVDHNLCTLDGKKHFMEQHVSEEDLAGINILYDSFVNGKSSDEELTKSKVLEKVHGAIGNKMNHLSTTSRTAKLWIQYISYIDVIKQFICGDCHGVDCENGTREIDEESNDEDGNIFDIFDNNSF